MRSEQTPDGARRSLSPPDAAELARLREAVYGRPGAGGGDATAEQVAALEALEIRFQENGTRIVLPVGEIQDITDPAIDVETDDDPEPVRSDEARPIPVSARAVRIAAAAAGAALIAALAYWGGTVTASPPPEDAPAAIGSLGGGLPEFQRAQTDEDLLPPDILATTAVDLDLDPSTSRFLATVDGISLYLVLMEESAGSVCVVTSEAGATGGTFQGIGCEGGGASGGSSLGRLLSPSLWLQIGVPSEPVIGHPLVLSESVIVYRR